MDNNKSSVEFDPVNHIYRVGGKILPSVTQLLPKQDYYVSDDRLAECAEEGIANHAAVEDMIKTGVSSCGYTDAVKRFMDELRDIIGCLIGCEIPLASKKGFAGTPDLIFENGIVDLKRGLRDKRIHALQTSGYNLLAVENGLIKPTKQQYILIAHDDGTYDAVNVYNSMAEGVFLSLVQKHKIEKTLEYYLKSI